MRATFFILSMLAYVALAFWVSYEIGCMRLPGAAGVIAKASIFVYVSLRFQEGGIHLKQMFYGVQGQ